MTLEIENRCSQLLRELRRRKGYTLEEFEKLTGGKVKAVVLGSYERGTRAISLARLQQLSDYYEVPIQYFFSEKSREVTQEGRYTFDLRRIRARDEVDETLIGIRRFISNIATKRADWNGEIISIRESDNEVLALINQLNSRDLTELLTLSGYLFPTRINERQTP